MGRILSLLGLTLAGANSSIWISVLFVDAVMCSGQAILQACDLFLQGSAITHSRCGGQFAHYSAAHYFSKVHYYQTLQM